MDLEKLLKEMLELKEQNLKLQIANAELEAELKSKPSDNAYKIFQKAVDDKINKFYNSDNVREKESAYMLSLFNQSRNRAKRRLIDDLKWGLRIRYIGNITDELLPDALRFIETYSIEGKI